MSQKADNEFELPIETKVLNHGLVAITAYSGSDTTPANIARTSYRNSSQDEDNLDFERNRKLTTYLLKHKHTTPFEFIDVTFYVVCPIFVARQWHRHRTASINEESLRYVNARDEFYIPKLDRILSQSTDNKQGSSENLIDNPEIARNIIGKNSETCLRNYENLLAMGLAKELARSVLPVNLFTAYYWKANLHNIFHFLDLRTDPHAQWEIRQYALAMEEQLTVIFPNIMECRDAVNKLR